mmetsp:Transcript_19576/g.21253  ORF Transcript_19576/g.21253 Transcript_19576/m.21253 type:complete len:103 (-) Transcript_19576:1682-1990(-)
MEERRCATVTVVLSAVAERRVSMISFSAKASTEDVTSSHKMSEGFLKIALAIETFCLSPPDSLAPLSPTFVSSPRGNLSIVPLRLLLSIALCTSSDVALTLP